MPRTRIAVVGSGRDLQRVRQVLIDSGLSGELFTDASSLREGFDGLVVLDRLDAVGATRALVGEDAAIIAIVAPADAPLALRAGATDVVATGAPDVLLKARVGNLWSARESDILGRELAGAHEAFVKIQQVLAARGSDPTALREALIAARDVVGYERASLIASVEASERAVVIAATDDPTLQQFALGVWDYPEIREATRQGEPVIINDALEHPITAEVAAKVRDAGVRAIVVVPMVWNKRALGAVVFRNNKPATDSLPATLLSFAQLFASRIAAYVAESSAVRSLREQTNRISRDSYETEKRRRTVSSLVEHFEAAADGVVVVDEQGKIMFVNGVAETITGFARDALVGAELEDLILDEEKHNFQNAVASVLGGKNLEAFDLNLSTTSGQPVCVSVSTSTVLSKSGAVILSFREVTQERALEIELRKTKEFLEKMIDSTVDGIVAADTRGTMILFNQGAERIFGYSASEVIGDKHVWELYPDGVAKQVMEMLRSETHGGVGRLEQTRREVRTKSGELVPVNMTASVIYEDNREVATVGIFSDLRERIRIEQRLLKAQEKLEVTEKRALVAQLAGTAAHELNQPLTSIMGYAQLVHRQLESETRGARAVDTILSEAERMAEIVRKIGRITRFETKEYVGSASIIDLDKSVETTGECAAAVLEDEADDEERDDTDRSAGPLVDIDVGAGIDEVVDDAVDDAGPATVRIGKLILGSGDQAIARKRTLKIPLLTDDDPAEGTS